jgi:hypothetical protein
VRFSRFLRRCHVSCYPGRGQDERYSPDAALEAAPRRQAHAYKHAPPRKFTKTTVAKMRLLSLHRLGRNFYHRSGQPSINLNNFCVASRSKEIRSPLHLCKYAISVFETLRKMSCDSKPLLLCMAVLQHQRGILSHKKGGMRVFDRVSRSSRASPRTPLRVAPESGSRQGKPVAGTGATVASVASRLL